MYNLKRDIIQKKKKQAFRRLSQSGKKGTSPTSPGIAGRQTLALTARAKAGKASGRMQNPFLKTASTPQRATQGNPFLAQIAKQNQAGGGSSGPAGWPVPPQPPTYAAVVSGKRQEGQRSPVKAGKGAVPSFITHGPNSISVSASSQSSISINPFLTQSSLGLAPSQAQGTFPSLSLPSTQEFQAGGLQSTTSGNPFLKILQGHLQPAIATPPLQTGFMMQGGQNQSPSIPGVGPIPQAPVNMGGLFPSNMPMAVPPPPPPYPGPVYSSPPPYMGVQQPPSSFGEVSSSAQTGPNAAALVPQPIPQPSNTALHLKGVPDELNNPPFLKRHFSRFGKVTLLRCYPVRRCATVVFANTESAVMAKKVGKRLTSQHPPIHIFWSTARIPVKAKSAVWSPTSPREQLQAPTTGSAVSQDPRLHSPAGQMVQSKEGSEVQSSQEETTEEPIKKSPFKSIAYEVKKRTGLPEAKAPKKSIWDRLGKKNGSAPITEKENSEEKGLKITLKSQGERKVSRVATKKKAPAKKVKKRADGDEEWMPNEGERDEGWESEEGGDEGVYEGRGVISELGIREEGGEAMDLIARVAHHPYYLRSLERSETYPGPSGTTHVAHPAPAPAPSYEFPTLTLPPPPRPKGSAPGDYYEALDARDQEIRKGVVKQTSLMEAQAIVGTCPDMCPEKERYVREDRRLLSIFEIDPHSQPANPRVDHARAIKEYSGSAADKEEPLPHELRPQGVLQMTMDHLVTTVMDAGEGRRAEWYDFVWNRTRAIRKDITLQHLCTPVCAELIEKCARFHILCGHLLCEEEMSVFDPKMNNENLTKCLQSLKEFYRDIHTQKGVHCPNEAEFCSYDLLMHLTDDSVLILVQQYSPSVRHTPPVRLAVEAALAIDSNNFVRFFKLVRSATFLQACIMHRCFGLVRSRALRVMNRAHSTQKQALSFPLTNLTRMLAFEDEIEAMEFCEHYGLSVDQVHVQFVRGGLGLPEQALPIRRSYRYVHSKITKSFGEVVHGGPLPPPPTLPPPYCSFTQGTQAALPPRQPSPAPSLPTYTQEDLVAVVMSLEEAAVREELKEVVTECVKEEEQAELVARVSSSLCEELVGDAVLSGCREVAQSSLLQAIKQRDYELEQARVREMMMSEIVTAVVREESSKVAQDVLRDCVLQAEAYKAALSHVASVMVEEGVVGVVREVCGEVLSLVKQERRETLEALRKQFLTWQLQKYWKRWLHIVEVRQHIRQCASDIPPLPPLVSLPWQLGNLVPLEKRRRVESPLDPLSPGSRSRSEVVSEMLQTSRLEVQEKRKAFISPLELPALLQDALLASRTLLPTLSPLSSHPHPPHTPPDISWLLVLVHPAKQDLSPGDDKILDWLKGKLRLDPPQSNPPTGTGIETLSLSSTAIPTHRGSSTRRLQIAVKCVSSGAEGAGLGEELRGASAIMVCVPTPQPGQSEVAYCHWMEQVVSMVTNHTGHAPRLPLVVIGSQRMEQEFLSHWFKLSAEFNYLTEHSQISEVVFRVLDLPNAASDYPTVPEQQVCSALQWAAEHSPPQPSLSHLPLRDYIEHGLLEYFLPLVVDDCKIRQKAGLPSQSPSSLVGLYNVVLDHLSQSATHPELLELSWPIRDFAPQHFSHRGPPPFYWNSLAYLQAIQYCTLSLRLPAPPGGLGAGVGSTGEWSTRCAECLEYVAGVQLPGGDQRSIVPLLSRIKALLHHHYKQFGGHMTSTGTDQSDCSIPWDQVILTCVEHMVAQVTSDLWVSCFHGNKREFTTPPVWLRAQAETSVAQVIQMTSPAASHKRHRPHRRSDPSPPTSTPHLAPHTITVDVSPRLRGVYEQRTKLEDHIRREKTLAESFEAQLQRWVSTTEDPVVAEPGGGCGLQESPTPSPHLHWEGSLQSGLALLRVRLKSARWQEMVDSIHYHKLANSPT